MSNELESLKKVFEIAKNPEKILENPTSLIDQKIDEVGVTSSTRTEAQWLKNDISSWSTTNQIDTLSWIFSDANNLAGSFGESTSNIDIKTLVSDQFKWDLEKINSGWIDWLNWMISAYQKLWKLTDWASTAMDAVLSGQDPKQAFLEVFTKQQFNEMSEDIQDTVLSSKNEEFKNQFYSWFEWKNNLDRTTLDKFLTENKDKINEYIVNSWWKIDLEDFLRNGIWYENIKTNYPQIVETAKTDLDNYKKVFKNKILNQVWVESLTEEEQKKVDEIINKYWERAQNRFNINKETVTFQMKDVFVNTWETLWLTLELVSVNSLKIWTNLVTHFWKDIWNTGVTAWKICIWTITWDTDSDIIELSMSSFDKTYDALSDNQKIAFISLVYRKSWLFAWGIWQIWYLFWRAISYPLEFSSDISWLNAAYKWTMGKFDNISNMLLKIDSKFAWVNTVNRPDVAKIIPEFRNVITSAANESKVFNIYNIANWDLEKFSTMLDWIELDNTYKNTVKNIFSEIKANWWNFDDLWLKLAEEMRIWASQTQKAKIMTWFKNYIAWDFFDSTRTIISNNIDDVNNYRRTIQSGFNTWTKYLDYLKRFDRAFKIQKIAWESNRTLIKISSTDDIAKLKTFALEAPWIFKWICWAMPIIAVASVAASSEDKLEGIGKWLLSIVPLVGPYFIMSESGIKEWRIHNMPELALWATLFAFDVYGLIKAAKVWKTLWVLEYWLRPIKDVTGLLKNTFALLKTLKDWWKAVFGLIRAWKTAEALYEARLAIKSTPKAWWIWLIACLWIVAYVGYNTFWKKSEAEIMAEIEEKYINKQTGELDSEKLKSLPDNYKETLLWAICAWDNLENFSSKKSTIEIKWDTWTVWLSYIIDSFKKQDIRNFAAENLGLSDVKFMYNKEWLVDYISQIKNQWYDEIAAKELLIAAWIDEKNTNYIVTKAYKWVVLQN